MLTDCLTCQNLSCCDQQERWDSGCINYKMMPTKNPTNADKIRSMTDKELAEFLRPVKCVDCHLLDCGVEEMNFKKTCEERILDWLREECKSEN